LRLAALVLVVSAASVGFNWAQNEMNVQFHAFQDTRGVTVLSPAIDLSRDFTDRDSIRVKFGVDAITAASDSCARCHADGARNGRFVIGASLLRKYGDVKVTLGGEFSQENFYRATTGLTSISRDFNTGNTTVAGGFSFSLNQPQLHPSSQLEHQYTTDAFGSVTQTLSRTSLVQASYELAQVNGYQTNPFLRASVNNAMVLGNSPDSRTRQTVMARLRQALPADTYVEADLRRYHDSWSVDSTSISVGASHHFSQQVLAGVTYRWYDQTGAYFYQPSYVGNPQYFTSDFRLVPFDSGLYSGRLVITPRSSVFGLKEGTGLTLEYERYRSNVGFEAGIFSAGLRIPF
jgi:hypothetical protein